MARITLQFASAAALASAMTTSTPPAPFPTMAPANFTNNVTCTVDGNPFPTLEVAVPNTLAFNLTWTCPGFDPEDMSNAGSIGTVYPEMFVDRDLPSASLSEGEIAVSGTLRAYQNFVGNHTVGIYVVQNITRYIAMGNFIFEENPFAKNLTLNGTEEDIFTLKGGESATVNLTVYGSSNDSFPSLTCFASWVNKKGDATPNRDPKACRDLLQLNGSTTENYDRFDLGITYKAKENAQAEVVRVCLAAGDRNWISPLNYTVVNGTVHGNTTEGTQCLNFIVEAEPTTTAAPTVGPTVVPSYAASASGVMSALVFGAAMALMA
ncbi:hypothetical protein FOL47_003341 [Perkinsus chesapeaki]|uniref:Uncharacterized protein n=1 Tax=Perkinsus chesapeaki TaxID=330153 RepID=A0A7J6MA32_PERCH|nr:hypothetical protein FOL47_003341 [Perkinsus chesapeaki]